MNHERQAVLRAYLDALHRSDYAAIKALFAPNGRVYSPFLGDMAAPDFFDRLAQSSEQNTITPLDTYLSASGAPSAVAYFQYDWTVRDGSVISFKVMDLFTFAPASAQVLRLDIIYDTHPVRQQHGNKYE